MRPEKVGCYPQALENILVRLDPLIPAFILARANPEVDQFSAKLRNDFRVPAEQQHELSDFKGLQAVAAVKELFLNYGLRIGSGIRREMRRVPFEGLEVRVFPGNPTRDLGVGRLDRLTPCQPPVP